MTPTPSNLSHSVSSWWASTPRRPTNHIILPPSLSVPTLDDVASFSTEHLQSRTPNQTTSINLIDERRTTNDGTDGGIRKECLRLLGPWCWGTPSRVDSRPSIQNQQAKSAMRCSWTRAARPFRCAPPTWIESLRGIVENVSQSELQRHEDDSDEKGMMMLITYSLWVRMPLELWLMGNLLSAQLRWVWWAWRRGHLVCSRCTEWSHPTYPKTITCGEHDYWRDGDQL